jgi:hypothetical protein
MIVTHCADVELQESLLQPNHIIADWKFYRPSKSQATVRMIVMLLVSLQV